MGVELGQASAGVDGGSGYVTVGLSTQHRGNI